MKIMKNILTELFDDMYLRGGERKYPIDHQLNKFISQYDVDVIDIKFTTAYHDGRIINSALLIYKSKEITI